MNEHLDPDTPHTTGRSLPSDVTQPGGGVSFRVIAHDILTLLSCSGLLIGFGYLFYVIAGFSAMMAALIAGSWIFSEIIFRRKHKTISIIALLSIFALSIFIYSNFILMQFIEHIPTVALFSYLAAIVSIVIYGYRFYLNNLSQIVFGLVMLLLILSIFETFSRETNSNAIEYLFILGVIALTLTSMIDFFFGRNVYVSKFIHASFAIVSFLIFYSLFIYNILDLKFNSFYTFPVVLTAISVPAIIFNRRSFLYSGAAIFVLLIMITLFAIPYDTLVVVSSLYCIASFVVLHLIWNRLRNGLLSLFPEAIRRRLPEGG